MKAAEEIFKEEQEKFFNKMKEYEKANSLKDEDGNIIKRAIMPHKGFNFSMSYNALENAIHEHTKQNIEALLIELKHASDIFGGIKVVRNSDIDYLIENYLKNIK